MTSPTTKAFEFTRRGLDRTKNYRDLATDAVSLDAKKRHACPVPHRSGCCFAPTYRITV